jgi:hypothetical protein
LKLNLSQSEVSQEFDLVEIFGQEVTPDVALAFGQALIDRMIDRTNSNQKLGGGPFSGKASTYSESYAESLEFKAAGKSINDVNMELSGGMKSDVDILEASPTFLKIGLRDETETKKAYNHQVGDTLPARPWFGVTKSEVDDIKGDFESQLELAVAGLTPLDETVRRFSIFDLLDSLDGES